MTEETVAVTITESTSHKEALGKIVFSAIVGYLASEGAKKVYDVALVSIKTRIAENHQ